MQVDGASYEDAAALTTMATSTLPSPHQCPLCLNTFSRQEHLHRHLVSREPESSCCRGSSIAESHSTDSSNRPFPCVFCSASFNRADARKRHLRNCKRRAQSTTLELPRPSRRRACDRCVRQKRACNSAVPCQMCLAKDEPCTYLHTQVSVNHASPKDLFSTIHRPARQLSPYKEYMNEPNVSNDTFAFTELGPDHTPVGADWDIYWPRETAERPAHLSAITGELEREACAAAQSVVPEFTFSPSTWQTFSRDQPIYSQHNPSLQRSEDTIGPFSFAFLAKFTSTTGFAKSFDCGTLEERKFVVRSCATTEYKEFCCESGQRRPAYAYSPETTDEDLYATKESAPHIWGFILPEIVPRSSVRTSCRQNDQVKPLYTEDWMQTPGEEPHNNYMNCLKDADTIPNLSLGYEGNCCSLSDPLSLTTHEIVSRIKEVISLKPRNSIIRLTWSTTIERICLRFFSPPNLLKYIGLYWACWHPNWPVIHKPTFSPIAAHPVLVAAMALVGACLSPDALDNENARTWFDSVEEVAFSDEDLCDNSRADSTSPTTLNSSSSRRKVQALQAAYAVCLYQNWEGSDGNKCRIRRHRYSTVVAVARDLGLDNVHHEPSQFQERHLFEWHEFVVREEFIRTLIYIFLLDTAFVIFNNLPPRMVIKELKMDLVCPEACFQAPTADECFAAIMSWRSPKIQQQKISLCSAMETVLGEHMDHLACKAYARLGILNLFAIASALHYLIFQLRSSLIYEPRLAPIRRALANWKQIWFLHIQSDSIGVDPLANERASRGRSNPSEMWKRVGFMRHAPEFWLLAKFVLERLEADRQEELIDPFDDISGKRAGKLSVGSSVLDKYDETSMGQVNDIITMFQRLNI